VERDARWLVLLALVSATWDHEMLQIGGQSSVWSIQTKVHGFRYPSGMN
jgi:hypothetical protein